MVAWVSRAASASPMSWTGRCAGPAALARFALPDHGSGGGADAGGIHGQLDQDHGKGAAGRDLFPAAAAGGQARPPQVFTSSPRGGADSMVLMYLMAIVASERTIDLSAAYFVPDELTMQALVDAMRRGVRVRIITPGPHIDAEIVKKASRASWGTCWRKARRSTSTSPPCSTARRSLSTGCWSRWVPRISTRDHSA